MLKYSVLQLDSVLQNGLLILKGELQSLLPYLTFIKKIEWTELPLPPTEEGEH